MSEEKAGDFELIPSIEALQQRVSRRAKGTGRGGRVAITEWSPLTNPEEKFCDAYFRTGDLTHARKTAGWDSDRTADQRLMKPNVRRYLKQLQDKARDAQELSQRTLLNEIRELAFFDLALAFKAEHGVTEYKDVRDMPADVRRFIRSVKVRNGKVVDVDFLDKTKALEMLAKHLDIYKDSTLNVRVEHMTADALDARILELAKSGEIDVTPREPGDPELPDEVDDEDED